MFEKVLLSLYPLGRKIIPEPLKPFLARLLRPYYVGTLYSNERLEQLLSLLEKVRAHLDQGLAARSLVLDEEERILLRPSFLLTLKPTMYIANVAEEGFENNVYLEQVRAYAEKENTPVVPICAAIESEIAELDDSDKTVFLQEMGLSETGLDRVIRAGYELLNLLTYFTAGVKEVRAWTVEKSTSAPKAASVIHTDFEKGFIRAEVISYDDFIACKGEQGAKDAGKLRIEGKDYLTQDGDIMHFRFNV